MKNLFITTLLGLTSTIFANTSPIVSEMEVGKIEHNLTVPVQGP